MNKKVKEIKTDNDNLLYVGTWEDEEYYQDMDKRGGWSFMGLRPETEENLRNQARESDPEDYLGISHKEFENISTYFDYEKFADDMEDDWYDRHDVQAERENENGEKLYLGFGSGQDIKGFFKEHDIVDYQSYCEFFDELGLSEKDFNNLKKTFNL